MYNSNIDNDNNMVLEIALHKDVFSIFQDDITSPTKIANQNNKTETEICVPLLSCGEVDNFLAAYTTRCREFFGQDCYNNMLDDEKTKNGCMGDALKIDEMVQKYITSCFPDDDVNDFDFLPTQVQAQQTVFMDSVPVNNHENDDERGINMHACDRMMGSPTYNTIHIANTDTLNTPPSIYVDIEDNRGVEVSDLSTPPNTTLLDWFENVTEEDHSKNRQTSYDENNNMSIVHQATTTTTTSTFVYSLCDLNENGFIIKSV